MFFDVKVADLRRQLDYVRERFVATQGTAYPNQRQRLASLIAVIPTLDANLAAVETDLALYRMAVNPALDTWRQLFDRIRTLGTFVQWLRTGELPAHLAVGPDAHYLSNLAEALHQEVGLANIHPVVTLHQPHWFAVNTSVPDYPLYFVPSSLVDDPGELPLLFHEIGHVVFQRWSPNFSGQIEAAIKMTAVRKLAELSTEADPVVRADKLQAVSRWTVSAINEQEEIVCDFVGAFLGGPSFVSALSIGLATTGSSPYGKNSANYPPLDCRMRVGGIVSRRLGLTGTVLSETEGGWAQVRALSVADRWHNWLYDDRYLADLAEVVHKFLTGQGVQIYTPAGGGLRGQLDAGTDALFGPPAAYESWAQSLGQMLRRDYTPP